MAMAEETKILYLDEVSSGVDPQSRREIWKVLKAYKKDRVILCSTHHLDEAEELGDKIAIVASGRVLAFDEPFLLKSNHVRSMKNASLYITPRLHSNLEVLDKAVKNVLTNSDVERQSISLTTSSKMVILDFDLRNSLHLNSTNKNEESKGTLKDESEFELKNLISVIHELENCETIKKLHINLQFSMLPSMEKVFLEVVHKHTFRNKRKPTKFVSSKYLLSRPSDALESFIAETEKKLPKEAKTRNSWRFNVYQTLLLDKRFKIAARNWKYWVLLFFLALLLVFIPVFSGPANVFTFLQGSNYPELSDGCMATLRNSTINSNLFCCNSSQYR